MDIDRLPVTGTELFGRNAQLQILDDIWESKEGKVVSLVASGGVGKSTLVRKWLERMEKENYRGAKLVYGWSFYSQGTGERVTSADQFINHALAWFGDADPTLGSPWDKGERLAELVNRQKTLLVLDGMEPLQSHYEYERGKINDPGIATLISRLAQSNNGLCLITTRENITDLGPFQDNLIQEDLNQISDEAGRASLRVGGVQGTDAELEGATRDFGNHALAINLLAVYLREVPGHHVSYSGEIPDLDIPVEEGKHPRRVMAAFEQRFGDGPEVELLKILGLFDRPADEGEIGALRAGPAITGLTDHIKALSEADWLRLLQKMRDFKLIAPESHHRPNALDAHPLVREHFGERLRETNSEAWKEAHGRLYEHLRDTTTEFPNSIEEMAPLYAAVAHGCHAGRHQEALYDVYVHRIQRGNEAFNTMKLGAISTELAALTSFFESVWQQPVATLAESAKAFLLGEAGFDLRAMGRLAEAARPLKAGLEADISQEDWGNAARAAENLSELHLAIGDLRHATEYAEQSVELADRSGEASERIYNRATLADALHQAGQLEEAEGLFREAEEMQRDVQPDRPILYSLRGFQYCDLMLAQGKHQEVLKRARQTLDWMESTTEAPVLTVAVEWLNLGRAHLFQAQIEHAIDFIQADEHLERAVKGLRQAAHQDFISRGLLARAELRRLQEDFEPAQRDLDEAFAIAERGGMGLHLADCHLGYTRLYLAMDDKPRARENLATAKGMIEKMGYHRRDGEVAELEGELL